MQTSESWLYGVLSAQLSSLSSSAKPKPSGDSTQCLKRELWQGPAIAYNCMNCPLHLLDRISIAFVILACIGPLGSSG